MTTSTSAPPTNQGQPDSREATLRAALDEQFRVERVLPGPAGEPAFMAIERESGRRVQIVPLPIELAGRVDADRLQVALQGIPRLSHPGILPIIGSGMAGGTPYYVTPGIEGDSLREVLGREFRLKVSDSIRIMQGTCAAVQFAHDHGLPHLALAPEHILVGADGLPRVAGFGVAAAIGASRGPASRDSGVSAAVGYLAPEQIGSPQNSDTRADIYALGVVAYETLAGERPFKSDAQVLAKGPLVAEPPRLAAVRRDIPTDVSNVVARAMSLDVHRRFRAPRDFQAALGRAVRPARAKLITRVIAVAAIVVVAGGALLVRRYLDHRGIDDNLVAIAPFAAPDAATRAWSSRVAAAISANVDGVEALHVVPAERAAASWSDRTDHDGASEFGHSLGAGLAVYGRLASAGHDSVRVTASVVDVLSRTTVGEDIEIQQAVTRMPELADSLALQVLREIGKVRRLGTPQLKRPLSQ